MSTGFASDTLSIPFTSFNENEYGAFLDGKSQLGTNGGFEPLCLPQWLKPFQRFLCERSIRRGRSAIMADCGLGKTPLALVVGQNIIQHTNRPALLLAPLGVTGQFVREAAKFGVEAEKSQGGSGFKSRVVITNYERLHLFDPSDFSGVLCDESGILKNFLGSRRKAITEFMKKVPYRLLCTATPAPNDYVELGTSSEALGDLGHMDMLARFFKNDDKSLFLMGQKYGDLTQKGWRFKAHAEEAFWRWVCSWASACRKPSDLGDFSDDGYLLPPLTLNEHAVKARGLPPGFLFDIGPASLQEEQDEQRRTVQERCEKVAELVAHDRPAVAWCHLNAEGDLLEKLIPGAVQVSGSDSDEKKEEAFLAFSSGKIRVLITKPVIGGFGLNWQHCAHHTFFPSHSFEQWYQCLRRSWRFGQVSTVVADMVTTEGSEGRMKNLKRKAAASDRMFSELVRHMREHQTIGRTPYGTQRMEVPKWL